MDEVKWLTKAVMNGNIAAMCNLARCYRLGKGLAANRNEADRWEREAELRASGKPFWSTVFVGSESETGKTSSP